MYLQKAPTGQLEGRINQIEKRSPRTETYFPVTVIAENYLNFYNMRT
jgi:hypothetical protein